MYVCAFVCGLRWRTSKKPDTSFVPYAVWNRLLFAARCDFEFDFGFGVILIHFIHATVSLAIVVVVLSPPATRQIACSTAIAWLLVAGRSRQFTNVRPSVHKSRRTRFQQRCNVNASTVHLNCFTVISQVILNCFVLEDLFF